MKDLNIHVFYSLGEDELKEWGVPHCEKVSAQSNFLCGSLMFKLPEKKTQKINISLKVEGHPEMDSTYTYFARYKKDDKKAGMLNI